MTLDTTQTRGNGYGCVCLEEDPRIRSTFKFSEKIACLAAPADGLQVDLDSCKLPG